MPFQEFLQRTLETASDIAKTKFGKVSGSIKDGDNSQVLTEADLAIGAFIGEEIQRAYPEHNIVDEEAGTTNHDSAYTWVVDPIDGTSNFAQGVPLYGIMIGLLHNNVPVAGGVALPAFSELYLAEKGKGATCNAKAIHTTSETDLLKTLTAYPIDGHPHNPGLTREQGRLFAEIALRCRSMRKCNSVFDMMMVARGSYGAFLHRSSKVWDNVAPHVILEEAGALYTDFWGNPIDYSDARDNLKKNYTVCTAPPALHGQLQDIIRQNIGENTA